MGDTERSYLDPKFEFDVKGKSIPDLAKSATWNWELAKRKVKRLYNQHQADKEWEKEHPPKGKEPGLGLGRTASLLEKVDD
jgi:hypothetical protein